MARPLSSVTWGVKHQEATQGPNPVLYVPDAPKHPTRRCCQLAQMRQIVMTVLPSTSVSPQAGDRALYLEPSTEVLQATHTHHVMLSC